MPLPPQPRPGRHTASHSSPPPARSSRPRIVRNRRGTSASEYSRPIASRRLTSTAGDRLTRNGVTGPFQIIPRQMRNAASRHRCAGSGWPSRSWACSRHAYAARVNPDGTLVLVTIGGRPKLLDVATGSEVRAFGTTGETFGNAGFP